MVFISSPLRLHGNESHKALRPLGSTTVDQVCHITNQALSEQRQLSNQLLPAISLLVKHLEGSPDTRAALTGCFRGIRQLNHEASNQDNDTVQNTSECKNSQAEQNVSGLNPPSRLSTRNVQNLSTCEVDCACRCHFPRHIGDPQTFTKLIGQGYIQMAGFSKFGTQCDHQSCKAHAMPRVSVQYCLPSWLASRMIFVWFNSSSSFSSPELLLRIPRVVGRKSSIFQAVFSDSIQQLEAVITHRNCTPHDVDEYGFTLFAVRTILKISNVGMIR